MTFTIEKMRQWIKESEKGIPYAHKTKESELRGIEEGIQEFMQERRPTP